MRIGRRKKNNLLFSCYFELNHIISRRLSKFSNINKQIHIYIYKCSQRRLIIQRNLSFCSKKFMLIFEISIYITTTTKNKKINKTFLSRSSPVLTFTSGDLKKKKINNNHNRFLSAINKIYFSIFSFIISDRLFYNAMQQTTPKPATELNHHQNQSKTKTKRN